MNFQLSKLVVADAAGAEGGEGGEGLRVAAVVGVLTQMLHHNSVHTKVAALDWILQLYNKLPAEVSLCFRTKLALRGKKAGEEISRLYYLLKPQTFYYSAVARKVYFGYLLYESSRHHPSSRYHNA